MRKIILKNLTALFFIAPTILSCVNNEMCAKSEIFFADPTIFVDNGKYYLTGTREATGGGFELLQSTDLKNWSRCSKDSTFLILESGRSTFGSEGFWAPQIYKEKGKYYLFYTANEQVVVAQSDSINGCYSQTVVRPIDGTAKNIDPFLFKDDDGKYYLYHVRFDKGNYLWSAEFDIKQGTIDKSTLKKCFKVSQKWEKTDNNVWDPIMEGPTVIKKDDVYYLFYSANHFLNPDYAVGYATAPSPSGPWTKHAGNPIIHKSKVGESGSGHGDIFTGLDGKNYYVYHVHHNDSTPTPRRTRIVPLKFTKDKASGIYNVEIEKNKVIIPLR